MESSRFPGKPLKKINGIPMIEMIYKKLNGEEIAETAHANPLFRNDASYMDKVYRQSIVDMNDFIKQQRHLSQEL